MSYILDALKKADAERERGTVPGLHSQALGQIEDEEAGARQTLNPVVWIGAGVGICLIAVLSWQLWMREPAPATPPTVSPTAVELTPPPTAQPAPEMARNAVPYPPPPAPPSPDAEPARMAAPRPESQTASNRGGQVAPQGTTASTTSSVSANKAGNTPAPASARVPSINELPDDVRRDLPQLVIGGAMYSDTPSSRMLIINSQVFHEGEQPYQGLVLEEIRLKSAVFKYRGYRYAINY